MIKGRAIQRWAGLRLPHEKGRGNAQVGGVSDKGAGLRGEGRGYACGRGEGQTGGAMRRWAGSVIKGRGYTEVGGAKAPLIRHPNEKGRGYGSGEGLCAGGRGY